MLSKLKAIKIGDKFLLNDTQHSSSSSMHHHAAKRLHYQVTCFDMGYLFSLLFLIIMLTGKNSTVEVHEIPFKERYEIWILAMDND